jgi:nitrite reductase (NO-forming)
MKAIMFGLALAAAGVLAFTASIVAADRALGDGTEPAAAASPPAAMAHDASGHAAAEEAPVGATPTPSFAGMTAADGAELAQARTPFDAALPALQPGNLVKVQMTVKDQVVEIAPGVKMRIWSFDGSGVPGPTIHVRQGQTVEMTLTNGGSIPHSIDFHAARIAPNEAFVDAAPGESHTFRFTATDPGVFMYHCGTPPVLAHIANGMYGAIVVSPKKALPPADREYVLVGSEFYLDSPGIDAPADLDLTKARAATPDWATFNGFAGQYKDHPLAAKPGETVRFWVVAAGPSIDLRFHVVGTVFDRAWTNQDLTSLQRGVQTVNVPAGGGGVFDVEIDEPGLYPIVNHAFAYADLGQVGILRVGSPKGTMNH